MKRSILHCLSASGVIAATVVAPVDGQTATPVQSVGEEAPAVLVNATVMHSDGRVRNGALTAVDDAGVTVRPATGAVERVPWSSIVGIVTGALALPALSQNRGVVTLASGERLPGEAEANASGLRWSQRTLGSVELTPTDLRWISFDGGAPTTASLDADAVRLRTGDRLEGFVSKLTDPLVLEARAGGTETPLPLAGVQSISFVTTESPRAEGRRRLWLIDGTVLDAGSMTLQADGSLRVEGIAMARGSAIVLPMMALAAIAGDRPATALARQPMETEAGEQTSAVRYELTPPDRMQWPDRRQPMPTGSSQADADDGVWPLELPAIAFDGPAVLRITISQPAYFVGQLILPRDRRPDGHFIAIVRNGGRELARATFDASHPSFDLSIEVDPPTVEIEIVDIGDGAIQDGLVIERGALIPRSASATIPADRSAVPSNR